MKSRLKPVAITASIIVALGSGFVVARYDLISDGSTPEAIASSLDTESPPVATAALTSESSVAEIAAKMLNTDHFYHNVSARLESTADGRSQDAVLLQIEQPHRYRVETAGGFLSIGNGTEVWLRDGSGKVTVEKRADRIPQAVAQPVDEGRVDLPQFGTELVGAGEAATMLHPFSIVWGVFVAGDVSVTGATIEGGRQGVVVDVTPKTEHIGRKFGSLRRYVIDSQTGIVLRQEQYKTNGELRSRDVLFDVVFDSSEFVGDFSQQLSPDEAFAGSEEMKPR